ncbi:TonB-dependent siderophore receptor [Pedobacter sp. NJ-S-72]
MTKKPYEGTGGEVSYSRGSYDFERVAIDFNAPIAKADQVYMRVNAAYNYEGNFQDSGFDKNFFIAPSLSYKVNNRLDLNFDAEISSGKNSPKQIIFFYFPTSELGYNRADQVGLDYKKSYANNDLQQVYNNANIFAQATYKISSKWTSQTNITHTYSYSNGRSPYFFLVPDDKTLMGLPASPTANYLSRADQSTDNGKASVTEIQQNFNGEFNIFNIKNKIVVGLDYLRSNSNILFYSTDHIDLINYKGAIPNYSNFNEATVAAYYALNRGNAALVSTYPSISLNNIYSAYVSDVINVTDRLSALAALRVDRFENINKAPGADKGNNPPYKQTAFSPKFGLVFQPVKDQVSIFGNYQNSFTNRPGTDIDGNTFKPEQANQLEGGVKLDAFKGKLSGTISYYYIKVKDVLRQNPTNSNFQIQDGGKISKGIEFELIANPIKGFNILTGFAYNENHFVNTDASAGIEGRRDGASMSPYSANLWLSYKFPSGNLKGLGIGFGGNYASDNRIVNTTTSVFTLPAYTVLNASVFYDHPKFRIGAKVDNLTNKQYWIGYTTMNAQKLRSVVGSVSYKF